MAPFTEMIGEDGGQMGLYVAMPGGAGPFPGVVVIQHAFGVDEFIRAMAERLAEAGYAAAAPDLYHRQLQELPGMERMKLLRDREVIADVDAAVAHLGGMPVVDQERLGIIGFCMGGRVAYLMASANPAFKACVVYYGGNIMQPWGDGVPAPFERTAEIHCPLMFHFGAEDRNPSPDDMHRLDEELSRHGKPHEFYTYAGAGHAFMAFTNPDRYRQGAAEASWPRTLDFFGRHLRR